MSVGTTLLNLRRMLRAEVSQSLNTAQGVNAQGQYDMMLDRSQKELWDAYDWPHLNYVVTVPISAGQSVYPYPAEMPFEAINRITATDLTLGTAINAVTYPPPQEAFNMAGTRGWPPQWWGHQVLVTAGKTDPKGQLVLFPVPSQAGTLQLLGPAPCNPLVADADVAVLDDTLITLFAAAEILAQQKNEGASLKLQKANQYLRRLLANQSADKRDITVLGGAQIAQSMMPIYGDSGRNFRIPGEG